MIAANSAPPRSETAERQRSAVSLYVTAFALAAAACFAWATYSDGVSLSWALLTFVILAALADIREVRLPGVGWCDKMQEWPLDRGATTRSTRPSTSTSRC